MSNILSADEKALAVHILTESFMNYPVPGGFISDEAQRRIILPIIWEHELDRILPISEVFFDDNKLAFGILCPLGEFIRLPENLSPEYMEKLKSTNPKPEEEELTRSVDLEYAKIRASFNLPPDTYYLYAVGVLPGHQGKGIGSSILKKMLALCDEEGKDAYLETHNEANVRLYERFGCETIKKITNEKTGFTDWYMIRKANSSK